MEWTVGPSVTVRERSPSIAKRAGRNTPMRAPTPSLLAYARLLSKSVYRAKPPTSIVPGRCAAAGHAHGSADTAQSTTTRTFMTRSEEHTSELQSRLHLVCRLLLEKKKNS